MDGACFDQGIFFIGFAVFYNSAGKSSFPHADQRESGVPCQIEELTQFAFIFGRQNQYGHRISPITPIQDQVIFRQPGGYKFFKRP